VSWLAIPSIIDKLLPGREERIRNKLEKLKRGRDELVKSPFTTRAARKYDKLSNAIKKLEQKLQNR